MTAARFGEIIICNRPPMTKPRLVISRRRVRFEPARSALPIIAAYLAKRYGIAVKQ